MVALPRKVADGKTFNDALAAIDQLPLKSKQKNELISFRKAIEMKADKERPKIKARDQAILQARSMCEQGVLTDLVSYKLMGEVYHTMDYFYPAMECYEKALALETDHNEQHKLRRVLGRICHALQDSKKVILHLQQIQEFPELPKDEKHRLLAIAHLRLHLLHEAKRLALDWLSLKSNSTRSIAFFTLVQTHILLKEFNDAKNRLIEALREFPTDPDLAQMNILLQKKEMEQLAVQTPAAAAASAKPDEKTPSAVTVAEAAAPAKPHKSPQVLFLSAEPLQNFEEVTAVIEYLTALDLQTEVGQAMHSRVGSFCLGRLLDFVRQKATGQQRSTVNAKHMAALTSKFSPIISKTEKEKQNWTDICKADLSISIELRRDQNISNEKLLEGLLGYFRARFFSIPDLIEMWDAILPHILASPEQEKQALIQRFHISGGKDLPFQRLNEILENCAFDLRAEKLIKALRQAFEKDGNPSHLQGIVSHTLMLFDRKSPHVCNGDLFEELLFCLKHLDSLKLTPEFADGIHSLYTLFLQRPEVIAWLRDLNTSIFNKMPPFPGNMTFVQYFSSPRVDRLPLSGQQKTDLNELYKKRIPELISVQKKSAAQTSFSIEEWRISTAAKPDEWQLWRNWGGAYAIKGFSLRAVECLLESLKRNPPPKDQKQIHRMLALQYHELNDHRKAIFHCHQMPDTGVEKSSILSANYLLLGLPQLALPHALEYVSIPGPHEPAARNLLGQVYFSLGENAKAIACLEEGLKKHPNNELLKVTLLSIQRQIGEKAPAKK